MNEENQIKLLSSLEIDLKPNRNLRKRQLKEIIEIDPYVE
jgi:hypothetical protein